MASINITVEVKGWAELQRAVLELEPAMRREVYREGLQAGGQVYIAGAQARAPRAAVHRVKRRGSAYPYRLAESIGQQVRITTRQASTSVGPLPRAFWGRWQERGTRFMNAQPYLKPTLAADTPRALEAFAATVRAKFDQVVRAARQSAA